MIDRRMTDRQRGQQALAKRRPKSAPYPWPVDGTASITAMLDAGEPLGPDLLARAQSFLNFWGREVPEHWRQHPDEWTRREKLIRAAIAAARGTDRAAD